MLWHDTMRLHEKKRTHTLSVIMRLIHWKRVILHDDTDITHTLTWRWTCNEKLETRKFRAMRWQQSPVSSPRRHTPTHTHTIGRISSHSSLFRDPQYVENWHRQCVLWAWELEADSGFEFRAPLMRFTFDIIGISASSTHFTSHFIHVNRGVAPSPHSPTLTD